MAFRTLYRIEHPRSAAAWVAEWQEFTGEDNADWWTEYDDYDEAMDAADACGGVVIEFTRIRNLRDAYVEPVWPTLQAAE